MRQLSDDHPLERGCGGLRCERIIRPRIENQSGVIREPVRIDCAKPFEIPELASLRREFSTGRQKAGSTGLPDPVPG